MNGNNEPGRRTEEKKNLSNRIQWQSEVNGNNEPGRRTKLQQKLKNKLRKNIKFQRITSKISHIAATTKKISTENEPNQATSQQERQISTENEQEQSEPQHEQQIKEEHQISTENEQK